MKKADPPRYVPTFRCWKSEKANVAHRLPEDPEAVQPEESPIVDQDLLCGLSEPIVETACRVFRGSRRCGPSPRSWITSIEVALLASSFAAPAPSTS
jgi:hypothetical protein